MEAEPRRPRIRVRSETVGKARPDITGHILPAVYGESSGDGCAVWPQVVYASQMVVMAVGYYQAVQSGLTGTEHLMVEIGPAVYEHPCVVGLQQRRTSHTLVQRVGRPAYLAVAAEFRNAGRCACAEKREFHFTCGCCLSGVTGGNSLEVRPRK